MKKYFLSFTVILIILTVHSTDSLGAKKTQKIDPFFIQPNTVEYIATEKTSSAIASLEKGEMGQKQKYLLNQLYKIRVFDDIKSIKGEDKYDEYLKGALAYHNLFLFLKARGIEQQTYFKQALKFYKKSKKGGTELHRDNCYVLIAALYGAADNEKKAAKYFKKAHTFLMSGSFKSAEYIATYYASIVDIPKTIDYLKESYSLKPARTLQWIKICDDFYKIKNDPAFVLFLSGLKKDFSSKERRLKIKKSKPETGTLHDKDGYILPPNEKPKYRKRRR